MAEKKATKTTTKTTAKRTASSGPFTADERAAMKALVRERKAEERASKNRAEGERAVLEAIDALSEPDRGMAKRLHAIVAATAPDLWPKTWYGMPAYARDGKVVCFFKAAEKFESRYATFGFEDSAKLDAGAMWPTSYALTKLTPADEKKIAALVKKAAR
ncbi:MAG TPA: DUF1801 domain-containing protein [Actinomycetota bacterium]|jgi:uncharacterized protein YdhG (YjbR/CyaY superfamily)|nr:DUF1801 domain-containing protein [Actinomycetota bacterium]HEX5902837.1 DUF1801 domain-containing protein [Actinomycetota bacterium]